MYWVLIFKSGKSVSFMIECIIVFIISKSPWYSFQKSNGAQLMSRTLTIIIYSFGGSLIFYTEVRSVDFDLYYLKSESKLQL